jgi:hypothetical protein
MDIVLLRLLVVGFALICGSATLAIAVSSGSMKVASVTVTAMIQGLIADRVAATFGKGKEAVVALIACPTLGCSKGPFGLI